MSERWNPLQDILNIQDRLNRIFHDTYQSNTSPGSGDWQPPVDIYETETELIIMAEIPGTAEDQIDVQIADGVLFIRGEKPSPVDKDSDTYYRLERPYGRFSRSFTLPGGVDASAVKATIKDGILKVILGKSTAGGPRSIKVHKD